MSYLHGVYGETVASNYPAETAIGTIPVYVGSLPVHRINANGAADSDYSEYVNKPILIQSYRQINDLGVASDDFDTFTLCEALDAHFMNGQRVVAPVVLINMFDPETHIASAATTASVSVAKQGKKYVGYINDAKCVLDDMTVTADGVTFEAGELTYVYEGDSVKITIQKEGFSANTVSVSYKQADFVPSEITKADFQAAVNQVDFVELKLGLIPTILAAPHFSHIPDNHDIMVQKCLDKAAEKWHLVAFIDLPSTSAVNTRQAAIEWKQSNQYNSKLGKYFWPKFAYGDKEFCMSTIGVYTAMATDLDNDNIPSESPSNKNVNADRMILADGSTIFMMEYEANELNAVGITTGNIVKQQLRLWGAHMGNYNYATIADIKPEDRFDIQQRLNCYILNYLQYNYYNEIDQSFTPKDAAAIVNSVQTFLDSLVNGGHLLYAQVSFDEASNTVTDLENGDLTFDLQVTYPIVAKSITFRLQYTRTGLSLMFGEGE